MMKRLDKSRKREREAFKAIRFHMEWENGGRKPNLFCNEEIWTQFPAGYPLFKRLIIKTVTITKKLVLGLAGDGFGGGGDGGGGADGMVVVVVGLKV